MSYLWIKQQGLTIGPDVKHHPDNRESQELFVCDNTDNTDIIGTLNILKQEFRLLDCGE